MEKKITQSGSMTKRGQIPVLKSHLSQKVQFPKIKFHNVREPAAASRERKEGSASPNQESVKSFKQTDKFKECIAKLANIKRQSQNVTSDTQRCLKRTNNFKTEEDNKRKAMLTTSWHLQLAENHTGWYLQNMF